MTGPLSKLTLTPVPENENLFGTSHVTVELNENVPDKNSRGRHIVPCSHADRTSDVHARWTKNAWSGGEGRITQKKARSNLNPNVKEGATFAGNDGSVFQHHTQ